MKRAIETMLKDKACFVAAILAFSIFLTLGVVPMFL
jgi:hypothetical protein